MDRGERAGGANIDFTPDPQALDELVALAAPEDADVLRVRPAAVPAGVQLDPWLSRGAVKGAFYSAAFIVRALAADELDIDPEEIEVSNVRKVTISDGVYAAEIALNDQLANSAGFVREIGEHWEGLLASALDRAALPDSFIGSLISEEHRAACATSGYDCLSQYRNMQYHGLLDWRLGLAVLRCLSDASFSCGLDGDFDYPELLGWLENATERRDTFCETFEHCEPCEFGGPPRLRSRGHAGNRRSSTLGRVFAVSASCEGRRKDRHRARRVSREVHRHVQSHAP